MSVEYFVAIRSPLPKRKGGWDFALGPVRISTIENEELLAELVREAPGVSTGLVFSSRAAAGELTEGLARIAAKLLGGALFSEDGPELLEAFDVDRVATAAALEKAMRDWLAEKEQKAAEGKARAKAEWVERMKKGNPDDFF